MEDMLVRRLNTLAAVEVLVPGCEVTTPSTVVSRPVSTDVCGDAYKVLAGFCLRRIKCSIARESSPAQS
jgi:hypothetical protein